MMWELETEPIAFLMLGDDTALAGRIAVLGYVISWPMLCRKPVADRSIEADVWP